MILFDDLYEVLAYFRYKSNIHYMRSRASFSINSAINDCFMIWTGQPEKIGIQAGYAESHIVDYYDKQLKTTRGIIDMDNKNKYERFDKYGELKCKNCREEFCKNCRRI